MKKQTDFQIIYDSEFSEKHDLWFNKLKDCLHLDNGYSIEKKFSDFRNELSTHYIALQKGMDEMTDNYLYALVSRFEFRERNYTRDCIRLFFEREFTGIQKSFTEKTNSIFLLDKFTEEQTLRFLANYLAVKKLHYDCGGIYPTKADTPKSVLDKVLKKEVVLNGLDDLYYWKHKAAVLQALYASLIEKGRIEENPSFIVSFSAEKVRKDHRTIWKGTQIQLVYLFFLLWGVEYKDARIFHLIPRLFTNKDSLREFDTKTLNSTFTNNRHLFTDEKAKLSRDLISIRQIVEKLDLPDKTN